MEDMIYFLSVEVKFLKLPL